MASDTGLKKAEILADALVSASIYHRTLDGNKLVEIRNYLGISQQEFADRCDHSRPFQSQIEAPGGHEVLTSRSDTILAAIDYFMQKKRDSCLDLSGNKR